MSETHSSSAKNRLAIGAWQLGIGLAVLLLDQLTKRIVYLFLPIPDVSPHGYPYGGIGLFQNVGGIELSINHITNSGVAWGLLDRYQLPLVILRMGLIAVLSTYLIYFNRHASWRLPMVLIIAGASGNVLDFFVYGHVVDMLHVVLWGYDFPVFNVADSAISLGVGTLFILSWFDAD